MKDFLRVVLIAVGTPVLMWYGFQFGRLVGDYLGAAIGRIDSDFSVYSFLTALAQQFLMVAVILVFGIILIRAMDKSVVDRFFIVSLNNIKKVFGRNRLI